jgi:acetolactate synthase-1/2/3 large subunit
MDLLSVVADAREFIGAMLQCVDLTWTEPPERARWLERCRQWKQTYPVVVPEFWKETDHVNMYVLMDVLADEAAGEDVIVPGSSGPCANIMMQAWRVKQGQKFVFAPALGAMGFGLPHSIAACLASGGHRTVNVNGDGGFQLNIQELETVHRLQLPIKFFVLSNGGYGSIMAMQRSYFEGHYVGSEPSSGLTFPSIVKVARAYGIPAYRIKTHRTLRATVRRVLNSAGPVICEVSVSPTQVQHYRVTSTLTKDGTLVSRPMEDLWPFLDSAELRANMMIPPLTD